MNAFYLLIKIATHVAAGDTLSIGLLAFDGELWHVHFSKSRTTTAIKLAPGAAHAIPLLIEQIIMKVKALNADLQESRNLLFGPSKQFSATDFEQFSQYSNGLLRFTAPAPLSVGLNAAKFRKLYALLVDADADLPKTPKGKVALPEVIREDLIHRVHNRVHTHIDVSAANVPGLYTRVHMDCLGRNGALIGAKYISFERTRQQVDLDLSHYFLLISLLIKQQHGISAHDSFYLLAELPKQTAAAVHRIWDEVQQNEMVIVLAPQEAGRVADEIEERNAQRFLVTESTEGPQS